MIKLKRITQEMQNKKGYYYNKWKRNIATHHKAQKLAKKLIAEGKVK